MILSKVLKRIQFDINYTTLIGGCCDEGKKDNVTLASSFECKCRMRCFLFGRRMKIGRCDFHHVAEKAMFPSLLVLQSLRLL